MRQTSSRRCLNVTSCVTALVMLALLAWRSSGQPRSRLRWVTAAAAAMGRVPPVVLVAKASRTAILPAGERLFGGPLPSVSLGSKSRAFQPEAYRRCFTGRRESVSRSKDTWHMRPSFD